MGHLGDVRKIGVVLCGVGKIAYSCGGLCLGCVKLPLRQSRLGWRGRSYIGWAPKEGQERQESAMPVTHDQIRAALERLALPDGGTLVSRDMLRALGA